MLQKYLLNLYKNLNEYSNIINKKNINLYTPFNENKYKQNGGGVNSLDIAFKELFKNIKDDISTLVSQRDLYKENIKEYEINAIIKLKIIKILVDLYNKAKGTHTISDVEIDSILKQIYEKLKALNLTELTNKLDQINSEFQELIS